MAQRLEDHNPDISIIYEEPEPSIVQLHLDSTRERSTNACRKSRRSRDVSAQKSRLRSKESVLDRKDENACTCAPFVEDRRTTGSMSRSEVAAFDGGRNSITVFETWSPSREFSRVSAKDEDSDSDGRFSRRQGTRTRSNEAITRPRIKKTPENLAYLCLRVIDENVMRCAERLEKEILFCARVLNTLTDEINLEINLHVLKIGKL